MALDHEHSQSSVGERRGQPLAPLQTNFSRPTSRPLLVTSPRTQRPRPEEYQNDEEHNERVPLHATPVKRQTSKSGLRGLFGRDKTARKAPSDAKLSGIDEVQFSAPKGEPGPAAPLSPTSASTPVAVPSSATEPYRAKTPSKSRGRQSEEKPSEDSAWKPPPLFQAFPQSIKHDTLPCPGLSIDSILRFHATSAAKSGNVRDEDHAAQHTNKGAGADDPAVRKKKEDKEKRKHLRSLSETIGKTEWSQKIYVLTTSGYILQYPNGGKHDRLPEKMLQLGPKSVAFASDAIPGKHWVLQVSQSSEDQPSTNTETHRPLLSRLGFHRSHAKRLARSFLLVFHTPEDLSSWLLAVRAQIEARGGKKYVTERVFDDDMEHQLHSQTSARQLVRKDPNRFSQTFLQPQQSATSDEQESTVTDQSRRSSHVSLNRRSLVMPSAPESRSESISTTHTDVVSPVSVSGNGQGRFYSSVSPGGVPMSPPKNEKSAISTVLSALDNSASPTMSTPRKRQSLNLQQASTATETPEIPRSQSVAPDPLLRSASPPAPNFSVPSFSQRFAAKNGPNRLSHMPGPSSIRGGEMPVDPAEIMSTFSSPPQSPGK
ncbi:peptidase family M20/M25/M40 protein, partial [Aspergillus steynii IBT 23096]